MTSIRKTTTGCMPWLLLLAALATVSEAMATEQAFEMTPVGEVRILELAPARLLSTVADGTYFENSNRLFGRLFECIKSNDIAMTVPVEADLDHAAMRFHVGSESPDVLADTSSVQVVEVPARTVAGIGGRGAYSESNLSESLERLTRWLDGQADWRRAGDPYAVFWNGPFTPWFVKRFEVHIPVRRD